MDKQNQDNLIVSLLTSLAVSVPAFCATIYLMESNLSWNTPALVTLVVIAVAAANFATIIALEHFRANIGTLTLPALLATVGLILLFVMMEGINRFFYDFGYRWLFPVLVIALGLSFLAIFKEHKFLIKCQLGFNSMALAVLWGLGVTGKVALPF